MTKIYFRFFYCLPDYFIDCFIGCFIGRLIGCSIGCLIGYLICCLIGCFIDCFIECNCMISRFIRFSCFNDCFVAVTERKRTEQTSYRPWRKACTFLRYRSAPSRACSLQFYSAVIWPLGTLCSEGGLTPRETQTYRKSELLPPMTESKGLL